MAKSHAKIRNCRLFERRLSSKQLARRRWQRRRAEKHPQEKRMAHVNLKVEADRLIDNKLQEASNSDQSEDRFSEHMNGEEGAIEGRFIVDIAYMLEQIHAKFDNHDPLSVCTFRDVIQTKSRRYGLQTQIFFQCRVCNFEDSIWTDRTDGETMDINRSAVAGTIATGIGFSQMEELFASMNIPCMSSTTYRKYNMETIAAFEKAAMTEMLQAGEIAKKLALERGDFIVHDGMKIPFITVVADCGWMKRSYKTGKYDSLSGVGAIVDQHTQKVIFIGVRNKFCCICEWAARRDVTPKDHVCFKNWGRDQASTGMESDALLEGFKTSVETHGLIYKTLIADGDSNVYKSIVDNDPYSKYGIIVEKKECVNHLLRNLARKVRDVAKTKGRNISREKKLVNGSVLKLRSAIEHAILHRQTTVECDPTGCTKVDLLKNDVLNAPSHVFGDHRKCNELNGFCRQETTNEGINVVENLKKAGLFQQLEDAVTYLSLHADSLLYHATNNIAESFNAIVCKLIAGKRINFGQRGAFQARCAGSVLQHNTQNVVTKFHQSEGKIPPSTATVFEARRQRKVRRNALSKKSQKESRALSCDKNKEQRGQDKNYGPNAAKPDIPDGLYDDLVELHHSRLLVNQEKRTEIEIQTRGQADSALWQTVRRKILTASNFGRVCRMQDTTSCSATVQSILYPSVKSTPAMVWGRSNETKAIEELQTKLAKEGNSVTVRPCGLFIDPNLEYLGASPDGIIDNTAIVEVKCPRSAQNYHPEDAIEQRVTEIPKFFDRNDSSKMNTAHHYYYQVQGQLHVTRADTCYFVVWSPLGLKYVKVSRDDEFWKDRMEPYLTRFYKECLLPEIIDSRYIRRMPIREPKYVLKARQLKNQSVATSKVGRCVQRIKTIALSDFDTTPAKNDNGSLLSEAQRTSSDSGSEDRKSRVATTVAPMKLKRTHPKDSNSWTITSSDEQMSVSEREAKIKPLKLVKRTSEDGASWVVSSSDEQIGLIKNKARIPPLKLLRRSPAHGNHWVVSSSDEQESAHRSQQSCSTVSIPLTRQSSAPTDNAEEHEPGIPWIVVSNDHVAGSPTQIEIDILESVNKNVNFNDITRDVVTNVTDNSHNLENSTS